ncbi:transporter, monovalent cation:proton antiporter-2 (CPA2) family protein [Mycobacterium bohemicum DSM 44277]|uniref:Transporter, monovalent cation:proton antiporter-2 (CPA2) family protein n=1 Tax=Mycobacterium bohemicum DSM 44277 TaxID=1236609 RepID=A0A0U0WCU0_MYCBE|nr:transporter, monovalent cation:proton antiporter-2 (CPA2) family protein [Mycobacterium bohemicum DSM 44277]
MHGFGFHTLALLTAVGFAGPLLASIPRLRIPAIIGELAAGLVIGKTGFDVVDASDPTFRLFANIGFGLVMFVVGTHVPVRGGQLRSAISRPPSWACRWPRPPSAPRNTCWPRGNRRRCCSARC